MKHKIRLRKIAQIYKKIILYDVFGTFVVSLFEIV